MSPASEFGRGMIPQAIQSSQDVSFPPSPPSTDVQTRKCSVDSNSQETSTCSWPPSDDGQSSTYPLPPGKSILSISTEDLKTPDSHVARDPRLIRLTGVHPFNCEPPLSDLFNEGFLTSENLHYVRNHGAVPECKDADMDAWTFTVEGMVDKPFALSVKELVEKYEQVTYPITLVCAGNRRKEQNVVRKSKGFSWGAAGLSTALWTGVPLLELLSQARPRRSARFVCFEGADRLPNGYYGTSVKLNWCQDVNRGILIAHKMNGEALHPDHGKPVRIVIPGQIGGRSVKWLKRIIVTDRPSSNWYHIYDNRVLPTGVTPEESADLPDTWKDERYAIYDLNTNSAIVCPAHDEFVSLVDGPKRYQLRGYAYAGGGKRVTRVEVTLDQGKTWRLALIDYPEDQYRLAPDGATLCGGKVDMWWRETSFCWCFWELSVTTEELGASSDVMIRAMDDSLMAQPRDMYWNVLGMMNNPWFRVVIHNVGHSLQFEHPTQPAFASGGWMERVKKGGGNLSNGFWGENNEGCTEVQTDLVDTKICMTSQTVNRLITGDELEQHSGEEMPWFIVDGQVYDGTAFLEGHPGGAASIYGAAGQDVTDEFVAIRKSFMTTSAKFARDGNMAIMILTRWLLHNKDSENAKAMMPNYHIGRIDEKTLAELHTRTATRDQNRLTFLDSKTWTVASLQEKVPISPDAKIFRFKLDHKDQIIGLPTGQHLMMRLPDSKTGEPIIRAYTPLSEGTDRGWLDVLVKIYYDTAETRGGKMTQELDSIPLGHFVDFKGPVGRFEYVGNGLCSISGRHRRVRRFNMICGGSGITPIFQIIRAITTRTDDPTECILLDGNRVEEDILCRTQLDDMMSRAKQRSRVVYCLSRPTPSWQGRCGRIDRSLISAEIGSPSQNADTVVLLCGPETMEKSVVDILFSLGWSEDDVILF